MIRIVAYPDCSNKMENTWGFLTEGGEAGAHGEEINRLVKRMIYEKLHILR
jgi:NH3-dependent NAD+ synthetase